MTKILPYHRAVVTGASSGIGAEIAKQLCTSNVTVFAVARTGSKLDEVRRTLPPNKQKFFVAVEGDLTSADDIDRVIKKASIGGAVDLLVNNAGVGYCKRFEDLSVDEINTTINTNLTGPLRLSHGILRSRKPKQELHIVFVTSLAGKVGFGELSAYSATKFALEGICEALRLEFLNSPVAITVLRPGITDTGFFEKAGMDEFRQSVKGSKSFYSAKRVASEFIKKIPEKPNAIVVGNDKYFLSLLPFIPFRHRFRILDIVNKI